MIEDKINAARRARLEDNGGIPGLPPEEVSAIAFNRHSAALRERDPIQHAAIQRQITLQFVQSQLISKVDFGPISGCGDKPVLFKSGAEKLAGLFNLAIAVELVTAHEDWDKGIFAYTYKAIVRDRANRPLAECVGAANTKERKYAKSDGYSQQNTVLKIAQKRAVVGAVLLATNASSLFANLDAETRQDLSGGSGGSHTTWDAEIVEEPTISTVQIKRLFAIAKEAGIAGKEELYEAIGISSIKELTPEKYEDVCNTLQGAHP
jgi:hypothetical protein